MVFQFVSPKLYELSEVSEGSIVVPFRFMYNPDGIVFYISVFNGVFFYILYYNESGL
mgnify:FL=1